MLREGLIADSTLKDGVNIFLYNSYAVLVAEISHLLFFFFVNIKQSFYFSYNTLFLLFFGGFILVFYFFYMSWYSCYKLAKRIFNEDLVDEELNPSILNIIMPQLFFFFCTFLLYCLLFIGYIFVYMNLEEDTIYIPKISLILFFLFFFCCLFYAIFFKYENSLGMFILGIDGVITLILFLYESENIYLPSMLCSGYYLYYKIKSFQKNRKIYNDKEKNIMKYMLCGCTLIFFSLLLKNLNIINTNFFSFFLLVSFNIYFYHVLCV
ncbi:conserved membrane protein, unknown function [Hepatocystis sp. ex Piliocolobus tephrosceles]|nr:conserved membrane protein, unknown function [Hepatocystis sp. ex Piliocolobus tephrosceles]